jgi:hypothetical protein
MVVFLMGFRAPPASSAASSQARRRRRRSRMVNGKHELAPLQVGDRILYFDHKYQHDFTKITLNAALAEEGVATPMYVERADGTREAPHDHPAARRRRRTGS